MYLFWYKKRTGINNFGDELNPFIIGSLTGQVIKYLPIAEPKPFRLIKSIVRLARRQMTLHDVILIIKSLQSRKYFVAIGSVIESSRGRNCYIWGAGLINRNGIIRRANILAVRGEITKRRVKDLGYKEPAVIGDPALLLPLIFTPKSKMQYELGIIPHYVNMDEILTNISIPNENILLIDVLNSPELVIHQINSCKRTISGSLHGIIVSHAYGIPSLWCELGSIPLSGDDIKFEDYFSSVNIEPYEKLKFDFKANMIEQSQQLFSSNRKQSLINNDLKKIQKNLLQSAPFDILKKYQM